VSVDFQIDYFQVDPILTFVSVFFDNPFCGVGQQTVALNRKKNLKQQRLQKNFRRYRSNWKSFHNRSREIAQQGNYGEIGY
jgi:hypothetical protein